MSPLVKPYDKGVKRIVNDLHAAPVAEIDRSRFDRGI